MNNSEFLQRFFEIKAGKGLPHLEDDYQHITFNVTITSDVSDKYYIVMFSGDDLIFPIILEFPKNEYRLKAGWIDIFYISKEVVRKGKTNQVS